MSYQQAWGNQGYQNGSTGGGPLSVQVKSGSTICKGQGPIGKHGRDAHLILEARHGQPGQAFLHVEPAINGPDASCSDICNVPKFEDPNKPSYTTVFYGSAPFVKQPCAPAAPAAPASGSCPRAFSPMSRW